MANPAGPAEATWRRLYAAARPVLDDPASAAAVDRVASLLEARVRRVDQERYELIEVDEAQARCWLTTRMAVRFHAAATAAHVHPGADPTWSLLLLAAACRLRGRYAC